MLKKFFHKIDKKQYPKIARKWSFTVYFAFPVFTIGNKLYNFLVLSLGCSVIIFLIYILKLDNIIFNIFYILAYAINLLIVVYLMIYGRIMAWERLGYQNNDQDIEKFKAKQKKILIWSLIYYFIIFFFMFIIIYLIRTY